MTPPAAQTAPAGERLRVVGMLAGVTGPVLLAAYFTTPALVGWPYAGASPGKLISYASAHRLLFYGGGWLQATGALLAIVFFLVLLQLTGARGSLAGAATLTGCAVLLSVVVIEAAVLEAVPIAAANGDQSTVATAFALSNGVFTRIFPLAPAPLLFAGIGVALSGTPILPRIFARAALVIAALFLTAGIAAVFATAGLIIAIVMSLAQAVWIAAAAIALARITRDSPPQSRASNPRRKSLSRIGLSRVSHEHTTSNFRHTSVAHGTSPWPPSQAKALPLVLRAAPTTRTTGDNYHGGSSSEHARAAVCLVTRSSKSIGAREAVWVFRWLAPYLSPPIAVPKANIAGQSSVCTANGTPTMIATGWLAAPCARCSLHAPNHAHAPMTSNINHRSGSVRLIKRGMARPGGSNFEATPGGCGSIRSKC